MDRSTDTSTPMTPTDWRSVNWYARRAHFIGIGGSGMSGLAAMLAERGAILTGTDRQQTALTRQLESLGIAISTEDETTELPDDCEVVVASAAVTHAHPMMLAARARGIPILRYAQLLGGLLDQSTGIAIAGTHGKSTTTAWLTYALKLAQFDPSFVVGAVSRQLGGGSGVGQGDVLVVEACEYDRSFLNLRPQIAVVLNIDEDHLDCYSGLGEIQSAFAEFLSQVRSGGRVIANGDNRATRDVLDQASAAVETFGLSSGCTWRAEDLEIKNGCYSFQILHNEAQFAQVSLGIPGRHNVMNALAVTAAAHACGATARQIQSGLPAYRGVDRRLEHKGAIDGVTILDDYAHHPTEIRATLAAIRERYQPSRLWCIFQPHQHSRTRFLLADFATSFANSDHTIVPDIYFVRDSEHDREAVNARDLVEKIQSDGKSAEYIPDFEAIVERLAGAVQPGDVVVTMGAGTIWEVADALVRRLQGDDSR
jgi:UDP-N-acetylmuramate--alanine ligase